MSIIHEALKKAQSAEESSFVENIEKDLGVSAPENKVKQPLRINKSLIFAGAAFGVLALLFFSAREPSRPLKAQKASVPFSGKYSLEGIIYDEESPSAIINGEAVGISDEVGGFTVNRISEDEVELVDPASSAKLVLSLFF